MQLDYASWMGIGGDHSCSPENMLKSVLYSEWILKVADVAAVLKNDLLKAKNNSEIINAIRNSDIRFQRVDFDYATRAGSISVHFLLARDSINENSIKYFDECMKEGGDLNSLGAYAWFHTIALLKASEYSRLDPEHSQRSSLILSAMADEAFALHFLEDAFASGHITGSWGNSALKKGTHDYYNEKGLKVATWDGRKMVVMDDAYMSPEDADNASNTVKFSLEQLISAAEGKIELIPGIYQSVTSAPDTFNVCRNNYMPDGVQDYSLYKTIPMSTPLSGLAPRVGSLPRFRSEMGFFLGASTSINGSTVFGGFGDGQNKPGGIGGLEANLLIGYGLDGVLNESGDGLIFLKLGWRNDSPSTSQFIDEASNVNTNSITSYIPGRSALNIKSASSFLADTR